MRRTQGQATVEYVALVALVAAVLGVAGVAVVASGVGERVVAAMRRALCVVTGGSCGEARTACVLRSRREADEVDVNLLVARLGSEDVLLREERADGTVSLTLAHTGSGGLDAGVGTDVEVRPGGRGWAFGSELRAAALASAGAGETYVVRGERAADDLERRLRLSVLARRPQTSIDNPEGSLPMLNHAPPALPPPDVVYRERGEGLSLDAGGRFGGHVGLRLDAEEVAGERVDRATGARTVYLRERGGARASLRLLSPQLVGQAGDDELYAVSVDRDGRPLDFEVLGAGTLGGGVDVPALAKGVAHAVGVPGPGARRAELEQHLDLLDPANLAAAQEFVAGLGAVGGGPSAAAAQALRARLAVAGTLRARAYAVSESGRGFGGHVSAGLKVGGHAGSDAVTARLVAAELRGSDGVWRADPDCPVAPSL